MVRTSLMPTGTPARTGRGLPFAARSSIRAACASARSRLMDRYAWISLSRASIRRKHASTTALALRAPDSRELRISLMEGVFASAVSMAIGLPFNHFRNFEECPVSLRRASHDETAVEAGTDLVDTENCGRLRVADDFADLGHRHNCRGIKFVELRDMIEDCVEVAQHAGFFFRR